MAIRTNPTRKREPSSSIHTTAQQRFAQVAHRLQSVVIAQRSPPLPQPPFAPEFGPHCLEERAAQLLDLIDYKRQHHQHGTDYREMVIAMAKSVLEVVALVLQRVERLIGHAPPRSSAPHELRHRAFIDPQVGNPATVLDLVLVPLPTLQEVDP